MDISGIYFSIDSKAAGQARFYYYCHEHVERLVGNMVLAAHAIMGFSFGLFSPHKKGTIASSVPKTRQNSTRV